ncbi:unnamed protein product [Rangifer tarandus platyrhynchus]|uniref:Uncharacterized protein n=1 Tax=Rangifer tarandus platyrhynchus TaxID=3082113 RepID=A0ABN8YZN7_RANTA|nr:unnamed protein product [Rangifer tarandus platyrhynchus]
MVCGETENNPQENNPQAKPSSNANKMVRHSKALKESRRSAGITNRLPRGLGLDPERTWTSARTLPTADTVHHDRPTPATPTPSEQGLAGSRGHQESTAGRRRGLPRQSCVPSPRSPPPPRPPAETARRTPSARPTAAAGARRAPNCRPGPTNAGRGGEVRAAGRACEPLGGRRGEAARGEGRAKRRRSHGRSQRQEGSESGSRPFPLGRCRWFDPPPRVRCLVPAPAGLYHRAVPPGFLPPTTTIKSPPTRVRGRLAPTGL